MDEEGNLKREKANHMYAEGILKGWKANLEYPFANMNGRSGGGVWVGSLLFNENQVKFTLFVTY